MLKPCSYVFSSVYKQLSVHKNFAICSYTLVYTRSVSWYTTLIPKFCQTTKFKIFVHIGFVNYYMAVTTNRNIYN